MDDIFWPSFFQAKDALFSALRNQHRPHCAHILFNPPGRHHAIQSKTTTLISSLLEHEHEVEVIHEPISQHRAAAEMSLRPIGALPSETIRHIVLHTVEGLHDRRQILRLSHVSKLWRETVLGISALFTGANWNR